MPNMPSRLMEQAKLRAGDDAYFEKVDGRWVGTSWTDYARLTRQVAAALIAVGLPVGGRICILGSNRSEWVLSAVGSMMAAGVPAGIYQTCSAEEIAYIIGHSEARVVVVEGQGQLDKVLSVRDELSCLHLIVTMQGLAAGDDPMVCSWEDFLARAGGTGDDALQGRLAAIKPELPATFIYTSGTTGPPKAVMLSHRNLTWTADLAAELVGLADDDCSVSYLPLSHIAEQMFSIHGPISAGSRIYFAESPEKLPDNLKEVQPTIVFGVPRVWEKIHTKVSTKLEEVTGPKAKLVAWARRVGTKVCDSRNHGREPRGLLSLQYRLANRVIYGKTKQAMGLGRARVCISGAAPISAEILEFFTGLDLTIHEVYGQSEGSGPTSFNTPGATRFGTVGPRLPGIDVKIADDGEILVSGPNVFLGYFKDPDATAQTLKDGWLHSGDLGSFDDEGYLHITGRKKEIIITAGGKNITPKNIESALRDLRLVGQAVVIGDQRKFLSALLTLEEDAARSFAETNGLAVDGLHESPVLLQELEKGVASVNERFARVEHIRKFKVLPRDFTQEDDELTPTLKIKRRNVARNWAELIDSMYV